MAEGGSTVSCVGLHRRTKDAAGHRPRFIEIAEPGCRIERGTGCVVSELLESRSLGIGLTQQAGCEVSGKLTAEFVNPSLRPALDFGCAPRLIPPQRFHADAEPPHIRLIDGEGSIAALRAPRPADEPFAGASLGLGQRCVDDLDELGVARVQDHGRKHRLPRRLGVGLWENERTMLIQIWERLRGLNRWSPTVATIQASAPQAIDFGKENSTPLAWQSVCKIAWRDQSGVEHTAEFEAYEESPLYQLCEGDKVEIRVNPQEPAEFYLPGLLQSKLTRAWRLAIFVVLFALVAVGILVAWYGPEIVRVLAHRG